MDFEAVPAPNLHHHINLIKCKKPAYRPKTKGDSIAWDCGPMNRGTREETLPLAVECPEARDGLDYIFLWQGAPAGQDGARFPPGVGQEVGGDTGYNTIVMVTHYPNLENLTNGWTGETGIRMKLVPDDGHMKKVDVLNYQAMGLIAANSFGVVAGHHDLDEDVVIHPVFAYTHTHELALNVKLWSQDASGRQTVLLNVDPKSFMGYHLIPEQVSLTAGDRISFACFYNNSLPVELEVR